MRNNYDEDDDYDYSPNELARLPEDKSRRIVESNLDEDDSYEKWQRRNLERAKDILAFQRNNKK